MTAEGATSDRQTITVPWSVLADYRCFGCSPHNHSGLRLTFESHPDGVCSRFRLDRTYESYPGVVHGGLAGVVCDEVMGNLIVLVERQSAFTVSMRLRYVAPLLVDQSYLCVARLRESTTGLLHTSAEITDEAGAVMVTATASYQPFTLQHARQQLGLDDQHTALLADALSTLGE